MIATIAVGTPTYKASTHYHSAPIYKEKKLSPQPFADKYRVVDNYSKNNFQKTETQDAEGKVAGPFKITLSSKYYQLQEHEQNIRRLGIIQENGMYDRQQAYKHLKKMILDKQLPLLAISQF